VHTRLLLLLLLFFVVFVFIVQVRSQNFSLGGGADPEAMYTLCLILKIISCLPGRTMHD
jgi:uncharacterized membrane protein YoaK (UPF0700 family)